MGVARDKPTFKRNRDSWTEGEMLFLIEKVAALDSKIKENASISQQAKYGYIVTQLNQAFHYAHPQTYRKHTLAQFMTKLAKIKHTAKVTSNEICEINKGVNLHKYGAGTRQAALAVCHSRIEAKAPWYFKYVELLGKDDHVPAPQNIEKVKSSQPAILSESSGRGRPSAHSDHPLEDTSSPCASNTTDGGRAKKTKAASSPDSATPAKQARRRLFDNGPARSYHSLNSRQPDRPSNSNDESDPDEGASEPWESDAEKLLKCILANQQRMNQMHLKMMSSRLESLFKLQQSSLLSLTMTNMQFMETSMMLLTSALAVTFDPKCDYQRLMAPFMADTLRPKEPEGPEGAPIPSRRCHS
eukprot:jgi/Botrbrau1/12791/Bobra.117_1s0010.1